MGQFEFTALSEGEGDKYTVTGTAVAGTASVYCQWNSSEGLSWRRARRGDLEAIRAHARTGRPLGGERFLARLETRLGRRLRKAKPGPKPKAKIDAPRN